jgi:hypothetical protein
MPIAFTSVLPSAATYTQPKETIADQILTAYPSVKAWWTLMEQNQRRNAAGVRNFPPRLNNTGYAAAEATNDNLTYTTVGGHRLPTFTNLPPASIAHMRVPLSPLTGIWSFVTVNRGDVADTEPWGILFKADETSFLYASPFKSNGFGVSLVDNNNGFSNSPSVSPSAGFPLGQMALTMTMIDFGTGAIAMSMDGGRNFGTASLTNLTSKSQDATWQLMIGRGRMGSGNGFDGVISEMMLVQGDIRTRADLRAFLRDKYANPVYGIV